MGRTLSASRITHFKTIAKLILWSALLRNGLCHFTHRWQIWLTLRIRTLLGVGGKHKEIISYVKQNEIKHKKAHMYTITWISWILLNPSFQKNSIKLAMVLGPGISFRDMALVFSPTSAGVISLSGMACSPAAVIPKASLAADLCKARKMKTSCLFSRSPWKLFQHAAVKCFGIAIIGRLFGVSARNKPMCGWVLCKV